MAVINVDFKKLGKMCGQGEKKIIECLTNIGMPVEEGDEGGLVVEVTPNRPDLFPVEGIARAVRSYYGGEVQEYTAAPSEYMVGVSKETAGVRPAICAAVVKGLKLDEEMLVDLMQVQEKLHNTIGRKRKKVAVGIHDLSKIRGKMDYFVSNGEKFIPLEMDKEMNAKEVLEMHPKGKAFAHLVEKEAVLIKDEEGVFSFPPIINGERTRVTTKTKDVLIESTGTSQETVDKMVNIIATALADRGGTIYQVDVGGRACPDFSCRSVVVDVKEANRVLGLDLDQKGVEKALLKMGIKLEGDVALVPPYRADIISSTDIIEDIAIGYGYENLVPTLPALSTIGGGEAQEGELHEIFIGLGFMEIKTPFLTNLEKLEATGRGVGALSIKNSASEDFTQLRTSLVPGLLGCFSNNKMKGLPQLYYEVGGVYWGGEGIRVCFGLMDEGVSITDIQPYLQALAKTLGKTVELKETEDPCFIKGRCAAVILDGKECGVVGAVHPHALEKFGLEHAVAVCELDRGCLA